MKKKTSHKKNTKQVNLNELSKPDLTSKINNPKI